MDPIKCFFIEPTGNVETTELDNGGTRTSPIYRRTDTGEVGKINEFPAGAMWFATWFENHWNPQLGPDKMLVVRTPGGDWIIDSQCSNCGIPDDKNQEKHHCWILHGTPPNITVDKNGTTCNAGGGSIQQGNFHGFLRDGYLVDA